MGHPFGVCNQQQYLHSGKSGCWQMLYFFWFHHKHSICALCSCFVVSLAHTSEILSKGSLPYVGSNGVVHVLLVPGDGVLPVVVCTIGIA
jgi:hypothetical protein